MNKEEILKWCEENDYLLIYNKSDKPDFETVFKIAREATGINGNIEKENRIHEYSFSRFLAISYLDNYYGAGVISERLNIKCCMVSYARNTLKDAMENLKYFKNWQKEAIVYFYDKIKEIEENNSNLVKRES